MAFDVLNKIGSSAAAKGVVGEAIISEVDASKKIVVAGKSTRSLSSEEVCNVDNFFFDDYYRLMTGWSYFSAVGGSPFEEAKTTVVTADDEITEKVKVEKNPRSKVPNLTAKSVKSLKPEKVVQEKITKAFEQEAKTEISKDIKSGRGIVKTLLAGLSKQFSNKLSLGKGKTFYADSDTSTSDREMSGHKKEIQTGRPSKLVKRGEVDPKATEAASKPKRQKRGRIWKSLVSKNVTTLKQKPNLGASEPRTQILNRDVARMLHHAKSCMQNGSSLITAGHDTLGDGALLLQAKLAEQIIKKGRSSANKALITNSGRVAVSNLKATISGQIADKISKLLLPENEGEMSRFLRLHNVLSQELKPADVAALYSYYYGSQDRNGDERGGFADQSSEEDFAMKDYGEYMVNGAFQLYYLA